MGTTPSEPTDEELAEYVSSRLELIGPNFADSEVVAEAIEQHRDLWLRLYELDREFGPSLPNPS